MMMPHGFRPPTWTILRRRTERAPSFLALLVALAATLAPPALEARQIERESRVPIAPEIGVLELSPELRNRLGLFGDTQGFSAARLFLREDGSTILEIETFLEGRLERERRVISDGELLVLRDQMATRFAVAGAPPEFTREGRGGLVLGQTLLGLAFQGWAVPLAFDIDSPQGVVAAYLLTAGAAFYLPYRLTRDRTVSDAHRDLTFYGGTRGILVGALIGDAIADQDGDATRTRVGAGLAGSVVGSLVGFVAADRGRPNPGRQALWTTMGDFGFLGGAATAYATGPLVSDDIYSVEGVYLESKMRNRPLAHGITLAGGAMGLVAGRWLGERERYTEGNVAVLRSTGLLGAHFGLTLARATGSEDGQLLAGSAVVGGVAGIVGGNRLLREKRFSGGEGLLVNAGHIAGAAAALGVTYLVVEEVDQHPVLYLTMSALGSLLGAGLVYRALGEGSAADVSLGVGSTNGSRDAGPGGVTFALYPERLLLGGLLPNGGPVPTLLSVRF